MPLGNYSDPFGELSYSNDGNHVVYRFLLLGSQHVHNTGLLLHSVLKSACG